MKLLDQWRTTDKTARLSTESRKLINWKCIENATVGFWFASGEPQIRVPSRRRIDQAFNVLFSELERIYEPLRRMMYIYCAVMGAILFGGISVVFASRVIESVWGTGGTITGTVLVAGLVPVFLLFQRILNVAYDLGRIPVTVAKYRLALTLATEGAQFQKILDELQAEIETMRGRI